MARNCLAPHIRVTPVIWFEELHINPCVNDFARIKIIDASIQNYFHSLHRGWAAFVGDFIDRYALNTLVEVEPPQLLYPNNAPFGSYLRDFQRKWVVTDEMLGRGKGPMQRRR